MVVREMLVNVARAGPLGMLTDIELSQQTGVASQTTLMEENAGAMSNTAKIGAPQHLMARMHADGHGQLQMPINGTQVTLPADAI